VGIVLGTASKDKIPISVSTAVDKGRICCNGPRQEGTGTRRVANVEIHFCQPERFVRIVTSFLSF
jgi:hypothetical protein